MSKDKKTDDAGSHIAENKSARRNYELLEKVEAGIVLQGTEVKSIRQGGVNINDSYGIIEHEEIYLIKMNIPVYAHGNRFNHEPTRRRKLLLHKRQITKLIGEVVEKGKTLVPVRLYWAKGNVKVELAVARGKTKGDQRDTIKKREADRDISKAMKRDRR